jgi:membrane carboxypeptidase/penicillin-binding protein
MAVTVRVEARGSFNWSGSTVCIQYCRKLGSSMAAGADEQCMGKEQDLHPQKEQWVDEAGQCQTKVEQMILVGGSMCARETDTGEIVANLVYTVSSRPARATQSQKQASKQSKQGQ